MNLPKITAYEFPAETKVFYTSPKTRAIIEEIRAHFVPLGNEAIKALLPGAVVWIDQSPYDLQNPRQGFTKCVIDRIQKAEDGIYLFYGKYSLAHTDTCRRNICRVADEAELHRLVDIHFERTHVPKYA